LECSYDLPSLLLDPHPCRLLKREELWVAIQAWSLQAFDAGQTFQV